MRNIGTSRILLSILIYLPSPISVVKCCPLQMISKYTRLVTGPLSITTSFNTYKCRFTGISDLELFKNLKYDKRWPKNNARDH